MRIEVFMAENNDKTVVLEGMYKGVEGKLDEVKQSVCKELQFSTAQQASAYESLETLFKQTVDTIIAEVRYLSQQNSAICDFSKTARNAVKALRNTTEKSAAEALLPKVTAMLDKLAKHNIMHKNKAGNLKSAMQLHVNAL